MRAGSKVDEPTRLGDESPTQPDVNQGLIDLFVDVVDQAVDLCVVGQTSIKNFTKYSKRPIPRFRSHCEKHVKVLQNLVEADVYVGIHATDSDRAVNARH